MGYVYIFFGNFLSRATCWLDFSRGLDFLRRLASFSGYWGSGIKPLILEAILSVFRWASISSNIEAEIDDIAIGDGVGLALEPHFAGGLDGLFVAEGP